MKKKKENPLFVSLTYEPQVKTSKRQLKLKRKEAQKELEVEKNKRRTLHKKDRIAWEKYKEDTKKKIKQLDLIVRTK